MMQELRAVEVDVMDDYDVREKRGISFSALFIPSSRYDLQYLIAPTRAEIQLELTEREIARNVPAGSVEWLSLGLQLEEHQ